MWEKLKYIFSIISTLGVLIGLSLLVFNRCSNDNDLEDKNKQRKTTIAEFVGRSTGEKSKKNLFDMHIDEVRYRDNGFSSLYLVIGEQFECEYLESSSIFSDKYLFIVNEHKPIIRDSSLFKYTNLTKLETGSWFNAHTNDFSYLVEGKEYIRQLHCDTLKENPNLYQVFYNKSNPQIGYLVKK
jgi:hypothetical protein